MRRSFAHAVGLALSLALGLAPGCGDDGDPSASAQRADQAREAALDAGLGEDVAEVLALAAAATDATYTATYDDGDRTLVVTQRPPDRRVDVTASDGAVDSTITAAGTVHACTDPPGDEPASCEEVGSAQPAGVFDELTITAFTEAMLDRDPTFELEDRQLAGTDARCLVTRDAEATSTLCIAADTGAVLLLDSPTGGLRAVGYSTDVGDGAFDLPAGTG
jgi:hypothetical protein